MYIAKMHTRYPEYHGQGYYNFIMNVSKDAILDEIERMSHDFSHEGTVRTRHKSVDAVIAKYPNKEALNTKFFERGE